MVAPLIPGAGTKLDAQIQAVLSDVRALVAERDKFLRKLESAVKLVELMIAERERLEAAILKAPHVGYCGSYADRACDCWKSDVRLGGTGEKPTVSNLIGATADAGYAQPCRCDRDDNGTWNGICTCEGSGPIKWIEVATESWKFAAAGASGFVFPSTDRRGQYYWCIYREASTAFGYESSVKAAIRSVESVVRGG